MTSYSKGRHFEYTTRRHLESKGFVVFRSAGSHSVADLIALRAGEVWLVQCKSDGYMSPLERRNFVEVAAELGVVAIVASRKGRKLTLREVCKEE
jgi:Holliday junction resolvase